MFLDFKIYRCHFSLERPLTVLLLRSRLRRPQDLQPTQDISCSDTIKSEITENVAHLNITTAKNRVALLSGNSNGFSQTLLPVEDFIVGNSDWAETLTIESPLQSVLVQPIEFISNLEGDLAIANLFDKFSILNFQESTFQNETEKNSIPKSGCDDINYPLIITVTHWIVGNDKRFGRTAKTPFDPLKTDETVQHDDKSASAQSHRALMTP